MSRHVRRNLLAHGVIVALILIACFLDIYYIAMPAFHGFHHHANPLLDLLIFIGVGALYFGLLFKNMAKYSLIPEKDPRLNESLKLVNH